MSYRTQSLLAHDESFLSRVTACVASEGESTPQRWAHENQWILSAQPGFDAAYAYAIAAGVVDPGNDEGVITDGQILAAVQAIRSNGVTPGATPAQ